MLFDKSSYVLKKSWKLGKEILSMLNIRFLSVNSVFTQKDFS